MRLPLTAVLLLGFALPGCEIVASFDRDKIPPPKLMRPDGSFLPPMPGPDTLDGGPADAAITDASLDSAVGDGSTDGAVPDGSAADASLDGGEAGLDAQVDGSTPVDAAMPVDGSLLDAAVRDL